MYVHTLMYSILDIFSKIHIHTYSLNNKHVTKYRIYASDRQTK